MPKLKFKLVVSGMWNVYSGINRIGTLEFSDDFSTWELQVDRDTVHGSYLSAIVAFAESKLKAGKSKGKGEA